MSEKVPEGWSFKKLSDVGKCIRGLTYSPDNVVDNGLLVLRSSNIQNDQISLSDNIYVNIDVETEFLTQPSDILICVRNGSRHLLGKSAFIDNQLPRATHGAFMTIYRSELNDFFRHHIKSDQFFIQVSRDIGATINSINTGNLLEYKFLTPPLPEQKKIASILTAVDEMIENTQRQIDKLQELKKATMNELLTKGIGHTEFKDSELGRIPKSWEVKPIGEICQVGTGNKDTQDKEKYGKYPFFVRSQKVEKINSYSYDGEAILTAGDGVGTGKIYHYIEGKFDYHQRVYKLSNFLDSINGKYLFYFFSNNFLKQVQGLSAKGSVESVRMEMITGMNMPIPSLPEQKKIASILTSVDEVIENTQRQIDINQSLKKSLMQDLLTGKVRVQV